MQTTSITLVPNTTQCKQHKETNILALCLYSVVYCAQVMLVALCGLHCVVLCTQVMLVALCCLHCVELCAQFVLVVLCCLHCVVLCA